MCPGYDELYSCNIKLNFGHDKLYFDHDKLYSGHDKLYSGHDKNHVQNNIFMT